MLKVYFEDCGDLPYVPLVYSYKNHDTHNQNSDFIKKAFEETNQKFVERVDSAAECDFIVLPHYFYMAMLKDDAYCERIGRLAQTYNKKIVGFRFGDKVPTPIIPNTILFKTSAYASLLKPNEHIMPPVVQDLSEGTFIALPKDDRPRVGFVGWAGFGTLGKHLRAQIKKSIVDIQSIVHGDLFKAQNTQGVFLRHEALCRLERDKRIHSNVIVRKSYQGYTKDFSEVQKATMRKEYVDNILMSDFTLAPRGDGNFSQRFYEVLSLGRFPVLIDTDVRLPLEDIVPYERFSVRVPYSDRHAIAEYILDFHKSIDTNEYSDRQKEAQYWYRNYLSATAFTQHMFVNGGINDLL